MPYVRKHYEKFCTWEKNSEKKSNSKRNQNSAFTLDMQKNCYEYSMPDKNGST